MKTIEQIALETAQEMGLIANSVYEAFAKQFLDAWLAQQEPVAWVSGHLRYAFERTESYVPIAVEVSLVNMGGKNQIPLFLAPPPAIQESEPHPPTRHCMCDECKPSFEDDQQAVPEGYVLVPKEPSEEMCAEGCLKVGALYGHHGARSMYQAMIAAAPKGDQE